jgi:hypothetical protein
MRILFWNTKGLDNAPLLATLAREQRADLLILAEPGTDLISLLTELNTQEHRQFFPDSSLGLSERLQIFYRYDPSAIRIVRDTFDVAVRNIATPLHASVLLVAVHLPSKLYQKPEDQLISAPRFARIVAESEDQVGHTRTVAIGDFNMSPFEDGIVGAEGFHAIMDRRIALRNTRTVHGQTYRFFYNPMWATLGDRAGQPPGSYYYDSGAYINHFWHTFDQVLVRPELLEDLVPERDVRILSRANGTSLVRESDGRPDRQISDHLPVLLNLELPEVI